MNNQANNLKTFFFRCLNTIGKKASDLATNAQLKLNEINLEARRSEIMSEFPNRALELWKNGVELPLELTELLKELTIVDQKLMILKAQKYAHIDEEQEPEEENSCFVPEADSVDLCSDDASTSGNEHSSESDSVSFEEKSQQ